jgi:hypothetical protein
MAAYFQPRKFVGIGVIPDRGGALGRHCRYGPVVDLPGILDRCWYLDDLRE